MAPEVYNTNDTLNPRTYYSEKADCWSMGIMMAELLTGIHPHDLYKTAEGTDFKQLDVAKYAELITHINHNKNLSQDTKDLIMNLLNVNPKFRYSAEKALESPFFNEHMSKEDKNTVYELQIQHQEKFKELANLEQDLEQAQKNPNSNALDIKYLNQSIEITGNEVKALQAEMKGIELLKEKTELEEKINISSKKKKKDIMHLDFLERDYLVNKLTITHCRDITDLEFKYEKEDLEEKINSLRDKPGSEPEIKQLQQQANQAEIKLNLVNMERELQILNIEKYFYQKHRKEISKIYKNKDKNKSENKGKLQNINERISNISDNRNKLLFKVNKFENENE
jgi:serine/threonine protein kinase